MNKLKYITIIKEINIVNLTFSFVLEWDIRSKDYVHKYFNLIDSNYF